MPQPIINDRFTALRNGVLGLTPSNSIQIFRLWQGLVESFAPTPSAADLWSKIRDAGINFIPEMIDLLPKTFRIDDEGTISALAMMAVNSCLNAGLQTLEVQVQEGFKDDDAIKMFKLAVDPHRIYIMIQKWWNKFRPHAPQWIKDETLRKNCCPFVAVLQFNLKHIDREHHNRAHGDPQETQFPDLQDFLLVVGIFSKIDDPLWGREPAYAIAAAVWLPAPPRGDIDGWMLSKLLKEEPKALVSRLEALMKRREEDFPIEQVVKSVSWFYALPPFDNLITLGDLPCTLASVYWRSLRYRSLGSSQDAISPALLFAHLGHVLGIVWRKHNIQAREQITRLISKYDLLAITEQVIVDNMKTGGVDGPPPSAWPIIGTWLASCPDALRPPLRRDYLQVLDRLRHAQTTLGVRSMLKFWENLGNVVGLSEKQLRAEAAKGQKGEANSDVIGCSWVKCPMYEQECAGETFRCAGCRRAMYCRLDCQKRDWEEGDHKMECGILAGVVMRKS
ncbi:hypothetical protein FRB94_009796 [Tulasnella sp. JGI-2019a]|nr:hypothetical protein FRB94_009796 [Tulasnella sp. JGI-2019a]